MFNREETKNNISKIEIKNLSKTFNIGYLGREVALSYLTNIFKFNRKKKNIKILDSISFDVKKGEILGIIGKNGSGKSSLLRIIAGIYRADYGEIFCNGEVFYLTSMGVGLMDRLTMKDNIFLVGSVMGLSQNKIKEIFDDIVDFSELREFMNLKVKQFSAGMVGRLAFSITAFCIKNKRSEILLLDEVFGSGADFEFEKKAIIKMEKLIKNGTTVVMVSHDLDIMEKYCNKIIWLDKGKIRENGEPKRVIESYKRD